MQRFWTHSSPSNDSLFFLALNIYFPPTMHFLKNFFFLILLTYFWLCWVFIAAWASLYLWQVGATLEKAMAPHSSTFAWKIPWMEEPGRLQSMGLQRVGHDWETFFTFHFHALEKEMATDSSALAWRIPGTGGAWRSAVYGVAQNRTRLKRLSSSSSSSSSISSVLVTVLGKPDMNGSFFQGPWKSGQGRMVIKI